MRVLLVSCVFPPEPVTSAITSENLAEGLVAAGHEVKVITSYPSRPGGVLYPGFRRSIRAVDASEAGYTIVRTAACISPSSNLWSRLAENISFGISSTANAFLEKADVVYLNTWPVFATAMISSLLRARQIPYVMSIQDVYPEAMIQQGKLAEASLVAKLIRMVDSAVSRRAANVVTISSNFARLYELRRRVARERIHVVQNWLDERAIFPGKRENGLRQRMGIDNRDLVALYAGNIGAVAGVGVILDAAELLSREPRIVLLIAGDGSERTQCEREVQRRGIKNVRFYCPLPKEDFNEVQAAADIMLLPTVKSAALTSVPSKMVAYMLSGRPILAAVHPDSDSARFISEAACGFCVPPDQPRSLADTLIAMRSVPDTLVEQGERARAYALKHFSRASGVAKIIEILEQSAG